MNYEASTVALTVPEGDLFVNGPSIVAKRERVNLLAARILERAGARVERGAGGDHVVEENRGTRRTREADHLTDEIRRPSLTVKFLLAARRQAEEAAFHRDPRALKISRDTFHLVPAFPLDLTGAGRYRDQDGIVGRQGKDFLPEQVGEENGGRPPRSEFIGNEEGPRGSSVPEQGFGGIERGSRSVPAFAAEIALGNEGPSAARAAGPRLGYEVKGASDAHSGAAFSAVQQLPAAEGATGGINEFP